MLKMLLKDAICSLKKTHVGILKWFEMLEGLEVSSEALVGKEVAPSSVLSLKEGCRKTRPLEASRGLP